jgi:hypothetical protein
MEIQISHLNIQTWRLLKRHYNVLEWITQQSHFIAIYAAL